MVLADLGAPMGAKIRLEKLLAVGGKDFTLLGRPILPRYYLNKRMNTLAFSSQGLGCS